MSKKNKGFPKRPWANRYTGSAGHCVTPMGALKSAICYLVDNDQRRCTIEGPNGKPVAQVHHNSFWGVTVVPIRQRGESAQIIPIKKGTAA